MAGWNTDAYPEANEYARFDVRDENGHEVCAALRDDALRIVADHNAAERLRATLSEWIAQTETDAVEHRDANGTPFDPGLEGSEVYFDRGEDQDCALGYETRAATLREVLALIGEGT